MYSITVPFHSIRQSRVTGLLKMLKCHGCHGGFRGLPNSFLIIMSPIYHFFRRLHRSTAEILGKSQQPWGVAETKISAGPSRVTGPAELIEMAQYEAMFSVFRSTCKNAIFRRLALLTVSGNRPGQ
jgi:hypothetical protein